MRWSSVGIQASSRGAAVRELVDILDNLNTFKFTDVTSKTRLLVLYRRVFHSPDTLQSLSLRDETIILLLCQWAVSADQVGRHRPLLVAGLIWARQKERVGLCVDNLLNEFGEFEDDSMETCSLSGAEWTNRERFPFQRALIQFLDRSVMLVHLLTGLIQCNTDLVMISLRRLYDNFGITLNWPIGDLIGP